MTSSFSRTSTPGKKAMKTFGPPEPDGIKVQSNQIVAIAMPHETSRAHEIRTAVRTKVL